MQLDDVKKMTAVLCAALACGCGGSDPQGSAEPSAEADLAKLEADFGGPGGLRAFFDRHSPEEIRRALVAYGIGYEVHDVPTWLDGRESLSAEEPVQKISDCPQYFPSSDRSKWHNFNGEFYYIDRSGRPSRAYADLPPIVPQARANSCQTAIGQWGDAENPANDYDGGHLIGSQLGGWGGRANVVPQDANFNRGNWAVLENKMADCASLPVGQMRYSISVTYANGTALVPDTFGMEIENPGAGTEVSLAFTNIDSGGPNGVSEKNRGVAFLSANGCN